MNEQIMNAMGFSEQVKMVKQGKCPFCHNITEPGMFRDALSEKEYMISGLCQTCQDDVFGTGHTGMEG